MSVCISCVCVVVVVGNDIKYQHKEHKSHKGIINSKIKKLSSWQHSTPKETEVKRVNSYIMTFRLH